MEYSLLRNSYIWKISVNKSTSCGPSIAVPIVGSNAKTFPICFIFNRGKKETDIVGTSVSYFVPVVDFVPRVSSYTVRKHYAS